MSSFVRPETEDPKVIVNISTVEYEPDPMDYLGHGTAVASVAAGTGEAGGLLEYPEGVIRTITPKTQIGVAPGAYLYNIKMIDSSGWTHWSFAVEAVELAVELNADIISCSWGWFWWSTGEEAVYYEPLYQAFEKAMEQGIIVIIAAGNEGDAGLGTLRFPGSHPNVITVGGTTEIDRIIYWSSRGPSTPFANPGYSFPTLILPLEAAVKPDIVAPGWKIVVANARFDPEKENYYRVGSGTSYAAPHASGAAALLLQAFSEANHEAIKAALIEGAEDLNLDPIYQGAGRLNVGKAFEILKKAPKENEKPILTKIWPEKWTSYSAPYIVAFPEDMGMLKMEVMSSGVIVDGKLFIKGKVAQIVDFYIYDPEEGYKKVGDKLDLGTFTGQKWILAVASVPEKIKPGIYDGHIELVAEGIKPISIPLHFGVQQPAAKILLEDVVSAKQLMEFLRTWEMWMPYEVPEIWAWPDCEFLWYNLFNLWKAAAMAGFDIDSLAMTTLKEYLTHQDMPPEVLRKHILTKLKHYRIIIEHDNEEWTKDTSLWAWINNTISIPEELEITLGEVLDTILKGRGRLIVHSDPLDSVYNFTARKIIYTFNDASNDILYYVGADIRRSFTPFWDIIVNKEAFVKPKHPILKDVDNFTTTLLDFAIFFPMDNLAWFLEVYGDAETLVNGVDDIINPGATAPLIAIDGKLPKYPKAKVLVIGDSGLFENLWLENHDWWLYVFTGKPGMWDTQTLSTNIFTYLVKK